MVVIEHIPTTELPLCYSCGCTDPGKFDKRFGGTKWAIYCAECTRVRALANSREWKSKNPDKVAKITKNGNNRRLERERQAREQR